MLCVHQVVSHANLLRIEFMPNPAVHRLQNAPLAVTPNRVCRHRGYRFHASAALRPLRPAGARVHHVTQPGPLVPPSHAADGRHGGHHRHRAATPPYWRAWPGPHAAQYSRPGLPVSRFPHFPAEACFPFTTLSPANACALLLENRLQFNAQQARLRFDAYDLALPLRRHEKALQTMLQRTLPLTVLQYRCDQRDRLLAQQVRQVVGNTAHMLQRPLRRKAWPPF